MNQDDQNPKEKVKSLRDDLYDGLALELKLSAHRAAGKPTQIPLSDFRALQQASLAPITPIATVFLGERLHQFYIAHDEAGSAVFATWIADRLLAMKGDATTTDHLSALRLMYGEELVIAVQPVMTS